MTKENVLLNAMNRGIISNLALARTDLKRTALSAEIQNNYMPRSLGSMMLRPGKKYIDSTLSNLSAAHIPFIFSIDDTAIIELTDGTMRVRIDENVITRPSVSSAVTNGGFNTDVSGWTDEDESGATSSWATGGFLSLVGTVFNRAIRSQQITVAGADHGVEHALRIVVTRGDIKLRVGTSSGTQEYISETVLKPGAHSMAFTPTGDFYIWVANYTQWAALVESINIEPAGAMQVATPWREADLDLIRWDTSADVIFNACDGYQQRRIERHATRSWSCVIYQPSDGPFLSENTGPIRIATSALTGDVTLTASAALWSSGHVGGLFRITSVGQNVGASLTGDDQYTDPIRVTGVGATQRTFNIAISGVWTTTLTLQRSVGEVGSWIDVTTYAANTTTTYADGLDNQIIYYRIGFKTGGYSAGTAVIALSYSSGGLTGIARITAYTSATSVTAAVLTAFGATTASSDWSEGQWSSYRGYPSAAALYEGRLWWAGQDKILGSISDAFESFDDTVEGDSGPISRSIGSGPVDKINWLLPLLRLIVGAQLAEHSARSSSLDEPLTPTNFNLKAPSTRGSSAVPPVKIDSSGLFVRLNRLFELAYAETYSVTSDYGGTDLTVLAPEVGGTGFTRIAVQRYPDTRIHCIREDGKVAVMIYDRAEDLKCWVTVETDGEVEDLFILPAQESETEDRVYYLINRTINGSTKRFLERWSFEEESAGGTTIYDNAFATMIIDANYPDGTVVTVRDSTGTKIGNNLTVSDGQITLATAASYAVITPSIYKLSDSHVNYSGVATTTFTAAHLAGEDIVVWGDGKDLGSYTLDGSGQATIPSVETYCGGLPYTARFKSTKLAYAAQGGTALTQRKRINYLGVILSNTHIGGLQYGMDFDTMDDLPLVEDGAEMNTDYIYASYDKDSFEFPGDYDTDSRLCLQSASPKPCTILAAVIGMETNEKL